MRRDRRPDVIRCECEPGLLDAGVDVQEAVVTVGDRDEVVGGIGERLELDELLARLALGLEEQRVVQSQSASLDEIRDQGGLLLGEGAKTVASGDVDDSEQNAARA